MLSTAQISTIDFYNITAIDYFNSTCQLNLPDLWDKVNGQFSNNVILDVGCGSGRDLCYFSNKGYKVVGIDISFNLIKLARGYSNQPVALANMIEMPFGRIFDTAWAIASLLHIPRRNIVGTLQEINRVIKNRSLFVASIKKGVGSSVDEKGRYFTYYQKEEWINVLAQANFELISIEENIETRNAEKVEWIVTVARS